MRVTICELHDEGAPDGAFEDDWVRLCHEVRRSESDLVLLPEMPFAPWFALAPDYDARVWQRAVASHERWLERLGELAPAAVVATRPLERDGRRLNEAFVWDAARGYRAAHVKAFLPREEGFWETEWYHAGKPAFEVIEAGGARLGVQICTEMWSMQHTQRYGKLGAQVIAVPRVTSKDSVEKWMAGGRVAAVVAGAFTMSSNRTSPDTGPDFGGGGWIASPDGELVAWTTGDSPVCTVQIDLSRADRAKDTYPRYAIP